MSKIFLVLLPFFALSFFATTTVAANAVAAKTTNQCGLFEKAVATGSSTQKLKKFLDVQWNYLMLQYPEWATYVGFPGQNDKLTDRSLQAIAKRDQETKCQLAALKKVSLKGLSATDQVNLRLALQKLENYVEGQEFESKYLVLNHLEGPHLELPDLLWSAPRAKAADFEDMIKRLEKFPESQAQNEILLREGLKKTVTPVKMFLTKVPAQFDAILTKNPEDSPIFAPFKDMGTSIPIAQANEIRTRALATIKDKVYPALQNLRNFLEKEYIPGARESTSWADMPNGKKWYAYQVKTMTTTVMTPDELHELGLSEVERLKKEMQAVVEKVNFKGDLKAFNKYLLTDSKFYYKDAESLMRGYRDLAKRIDPELPKIFKTLPRLPYGVREMPAYKAASAPAAYYMPGSIEGGRAGSFEANTHDLKARPIWGMEALTIHEAMPGHHLQIAISQELEGLPEFRKNDGYTAFVEGWALYAESLGEDMGFYKDPYSKYGQLSYEMWRAVRLVVDTGMHSKSWSREKALNYFMELMPKAKIEAEVEIDRYITWPGQALAYKVGQLKFLELRKKAQAELGEKYDIRTFHDEVLKNGAVPMNVLDTLFNEWLQKQKLALKKKV